VRIHNQVRLAEGLKAAGRRPASRIPTVFATTFTSPSSSSSWAGWPPLRWRPRWIHVLKGKAVCNLNRD